MNAVLVKTRLPHVTSMAVAAVSQGRDKQRGTFQTRLISLARDFKTPPELATPTYNGTQFGEMEQASRRCILNTNSIVLLKT